MTNALSLLVGPAAFAIAGVVAYLAPAALRTRGVGIRRGIAATAALAAVLAPTDATGVPVVDAALRAVLAAAVASLGSRASRWVMLGCAAVAAAASSPGAALLLSLAALGAAVGLAATARRSPVGAALVCALVVNATLRFGADRSPIESALPGALVVVPLLLSGTLRTKRLVRRRIWRGTLIAGAGIGAVSVLGVVAGLLAAPSLFDGVERSNAALAEARRSDTVRAEATLRESVARFDRARRPLDAFWSRPARLVPILGPHLRMASAVANAGAAVSDAGVRATGAADLREIEVDQGRIDLAAVRRLQPAILDSAKALSEARDEVEAARSSWLLPLLADRVAGETDRLASLADEAELYAGVVEVLPGLLGGDGARRYFLAVQTPVEIRGSGGLIGNYGEITAADGKLDLGRFGRIGELNDAARAKPAVLEGPDDYVRRYARFGPQITWQNVSLSPDFADVGEVIDSLYPQSGGAEIDGVISVDPTALAAILRITGPIRVDSWPEAITADNAEQLLYFEQYRRELDTDVRIDFLGDVAEEVVRKLTNTSLPSPTRLVEVLGPVVRGRHLLFASQEAQEAALLRRVGADGRLSTGETADFLAVVNQNAGGNKIDYFLRRHTTYAVDVDDVGGVTADVTVRLRNEAPTSGLPPSLIGNIVRPPDPFGTNRTFLSIYTPWGLQAASVNGSPVGAELEREGGVNVVTLHLALPPGETVVELRLAGRTAPDRRYGLTLQPQAMVEPEVVVVSGTVRRDGPLVEVEALRPRR